MYLMHSLLLSIQSVLCEGEEQYAKQICKNNLAIKYATIEAQYNICFLEVCRLLVKTIDVKLELEHSVYLMHSLLLSILSFFVKEQPSAIICQNNLAIK